MAQVIHASVDQVASVFLYLSLHQCFDGYLVLLACVLKWKLYQFRTHLVRGVTFIVLLHIISGVFPSRWHEKGLMVRNYLIYWILEEEFIGSQWCASVLVSWT